jgi:UDP-N-acetylglucosamine diphosphorylase / glucose-1-phosphate thymidylyltransferase / UDP-N-acetylgalactosamine diphosphorylase / glucosamine-1-phosphate N-acetyltransferase / galactosamine-1-phosphate N-acetyltransferase
MIPINNFIDQFSIVFAKATSLQPWEITDRLPEILQELIAELDDSFNISNGVAIHRSAVIEQNVVLKGPVIIGKNCFIAANAYIREGVFLADSVKIGPGCEIKQSIIFPGTAVAHFNYIGNSIVGRNVNFEAGAIAANHYNEREERSIPVLYDSQIIETGVKKFGSLIGDNSRIGANAVLSPGTILERNSIVKRLELVNQVKR